MSHLTSGQFVDLAEGTRDDASTPHLLACDACRRQLADLRVMMAGVAPGGGEDGGGVSDVPEPSPLFWDHLSTRVRDGVASERVPARTSWRDRWSWPRVALGAAAGLFAVAMVASLGSRLMAPGVGTGIAPPPPPPPVAQLAPFEPLGSLDDASLGLLVEYGSTLDWDEIRDQMAVSAHTGGADKAIADLNGGERMELQKLLKDALARPNAQPGRS